MRHGHRASAYRDYAEGGEHRRVEAERRKHWGEHTRGRRKRDSGRALSRLEYRGEKEREEDSDRLKHVRVLRDELYHAGNADDLAEDAARSRYEEYRTDDHERLVRHVVEL